MKVGSQLFTAEGPGAVERLADMGFGVFLALKFHDIPNTVAGAVASAAQLPGLRLLTLHTLGGSAMMRAAREAVQYKKKRPALLGVTILTSMDAAALTEIGISDTPGDRALALACLAQQSGLDGVVAKPADLQYLEDKRAMFKVKHERTAEFVVGGFRYYRGGEGVESVARKRP